MGMKILVLILIVVAVWYGFKIFGRSNQSGSKQQRSGDGGAGKQEESDSTAQDMESCSVCGTFVPNAVAKNCGREACPFPE